MAMGRWRMRSLARALAFVLTVAVGIAAGAILAASAEAEDKLKNWKRQAAPRDAAIR